MVYDDLSSQRAGFGFACSGDGLAWGRGTRVPVPGGTRTPFGLVRMLPSELRARRRDVLRYGVLNETTIDAPDTALYWLFYTVQAEERWEVFRTSIVQLRW